MYVSVVNEIRCIMKKHILVIGSLVFLVLISCAEKAQIQDVQELLPEANSYVIERIAEYSQISQEHKTELEKIARFINEKQGDATELIFICTHNSRRSHMSQIWAQVAAHYYGFDQVITYSGGTESTAFNPRAVRALQKAGLSIERQDESDNPVYVINYLETAEAMHAFSKTFSHETNPQDGFCA